MAGILARLLLGNFVFGFNATHYDSGDYLFAADLLKSGTLHSSRLLTYPALLLLCGHFAPLLSPEIALLFMQSLFGLGSAILLLLVLQKVIVRMHWVVPPAVLFAIDPYIISWEHCMMTESLALFLAMLMLYSFIRVLEGGGHIWGHLLMTSALLGIFLKLLFLWAVLGLMIGFLWWQRRTGSAMRRTIAAYVLAGIIMTGTFSVLNYKQNGINGLSETTRVLQLQKTYDYSLFRLSPDHEVAREMAVAKEEGMDFWAGFNALLIHHSRQDLYAFNSQLRHAEPAAYIAGFLRGTLRNTVSALLHPAATFYAFTSVKINRIEPFRLSIFLFLLPALLTLLIRHTGPSWQVRSGVRLALKYSAGGCVLAFVLMAAGSSVEFSRFFYPVMGFAWILMIVGLHDLRHWRSIRRLFFKPPQL